MKNEEKKSKLSFDWIFVRRVFWVILIFELISLLGYYYGVFNEIGFWLVLGGTFILSLWRLRWGFYIMLAELFIGSSGYLFSVTIEGFPISIRLGLFLVVVLTGVIQVFRNRSLALRKTSYFWWMAAVILVVGWGVSRAYLNGNAFGDIFLDLNAYLFLGVGFVFFEVIKSWAQIRRVLEILMAAIFILAAKGLAYYLIFASDPEFLRLDMYRWERITEKGQLAHLGNNLYRILFLSDIYPLMAIFIFGIILLFMYMKKYEMSKIGRRVVWGLVAASSLLMVISFFRSFWAAGLATFILGAGILIFKLKLSWKKVGLAMVIFLLIMGAEFGLVLGISKILEALVVDDQLMVQKDILDEEDPGVYGRMALIGPLWKEFRDSPILGQGLGRRIEVNLYPGDDPRNGSTFAFEWGYFDMLVKFGSIGLIIIFLFLLKVTWQGYKSFGGSGSLKKQAVGLGLWLGLAALLMTHMVSPYINHPLGFGYLLFAAAAFEVLTRKSKGDLLAN